MRHQQVAHLLAPPICRCLLLTSYRVPTAHCPLPTTHYSTYYLRRCATNLPLSDELTSPDKEAEVTLTTTLTLSLTLTLTLILTLALALTLPLTLTLTLTLTLP